MKYLDDDLTDVAIQQVCYYLLEKLVDNLDDLKVHLPNHIETIEEVKSKLKSIEKDLYDKTNEDIERINEKYRENNSVNEN
jgi:hypothetical protein